MVEFTHSLTPVLPALLSRVRALFDLNARPDLIAKHSARMPAWRLPVKANPGLRVPGAFNGFEMGLRAILGQQVTVKAATTIAGRFVAGVRRADRHAVCGAESTHAGAGAGRGAARRRHRAAGHHRRPRQKHHRAGGSAADRARSASMAARITIPTTPSSG